MELDFINALKAVATDPAARGLLDDAAMLDQLIITHDMLVEGVHFLASDPPESVAWKLVAVNLSDLAAKGAAPRAVLLGAGLNQDAEWQRSLAAGLTLAVNHFGVALIGGDTVAMPGGAPITLGLTAIGQAGPKTPSRSGARPGDAVYVAGVIGDAGLGLKIAQGALTGDPSLLAAYQRPVPLVNTGAMLAPFASAMMDVSDGLLIDAGRIAAASGVGIRLDLDQVPLSGAAKAMIGDNRPARLQAATAGDDYALLLTSPSPLPTVTDRLTQIGIVTSGGGLVLHDRDGTVPLPERLGWLHQ